LISKKAIFLLVFFLPVFLFGQSKVDSLRTRLKAEGQDTNRVSTLYMLANAVVAADPQEALTLAEEGLALAEKLGYKRGLAYMLLPKGDALKGLNKPGEALKIYEEGIKRAREISYYKFLGMMSNRAGNLLNRMGQNTEAIVHYREATRADSIAKLYAYESEAYRSMGEIYTTIGEHELAMQNFLSAIRVAEAHDETVQLGNAYVSMGNSQQNQKDYDKALESFKKSLAAMKKANYGYGIAGGYLSIANIYFFKQNYDSAIVNYKISRELILELKSEPTVARVNVDIANVLIQQKSYNEALGYNKEALAIFAKYNDYEGLCGGYNNIAVANMGLENYKESELNFFKSLELSKKYKFNNFRLDSYSGMARLYFAMGKYREAYLYKDSAVAMDSLLVGQEHERLTKEMEARFENRKKEEEIRKGQEKIEHLNIVTAEQAEIDKKQKQIILAVSCGLVIVLVLAFFLVSANSAKRKANLRLEEQNKIIAEKNKDITDSINYALRIQKSVMSDERILQRAVSEYFILNKPRDIVSGDFFWLAQKENRTYIAVADCTGHGVPGALVSVVGINLLNKIIEMPGTPSPSGVLELLHIMMIHALNKDAEARESNDGMDIALLCLDKNSNKAIFSGAGRPLYYADKNGLNYFKGDRYSVAGEKKEGDAPFTEQEINLSGPINFYLSSDGFVDQFGEKTGKKFLSKRFQELLQSISHLPMKEQQERIEKEFTSWKGNLEQVDDVLVMGVRV
jgi:tetratricopeptide (TPR) repeat protein